MAPAAEPPRSRGIRAVAVAIVLGGVALRLARLNHGLPELLEEATPLRLALGMWSSSGGPDDLNPHAFQYPSLTFYLHYLLQNIGFLVGHVAGRYPSRADYLLGFIVDPSMPARLSRLLSIGADAVSIWYVAALGARLGPRIGLVAATVTAIAPAMIVTSSAIFTDSIMTALGLACLSQLSKYLDDGARRHLITSALFLGLAIGAKYSAACLVVPLIWVIFQRRSRDRVTSLGLAAGTSLVGFLVTTPFALLDFPRFRGDVTYVIQHLAAGHLGATSAPGTAYYLEGLATNVGWLGLAAAMLAIVQFRRDPHATILSLSLLSFAIPTATAKAEFERYMVPLIPCAALLATAMVSSILDRVRLGRGWVGTSILAAVLVIPIAPGALRAAVARRSTQSLARAWMETHLGPRDIVVQEAYAAEVLSSQRRDEVLHSPLFASAHPIWRERFLAKPWYHTVGLPLIVAGPVGTDRQAVDLNQPAYDLRLLRGVAYVVTSEAVRGRFESDTVQFPVQARFYRFLMSHAEPVAVFSSASGIDGPTIRVYHLGAAAKRALGDYGPLDRAWWTAGVSPSHAAAMSSGSPSAWQPTEQEARIYGRWYRPLITELAANERAVGDCEDALRLLRAHIAVEPDDADALWSAVDCMGKTQRWAEARTTVEAVLPTYMRRGTVLPELSLAYALALAHTGDLERARRGLERLAASAPDEVSARARAELAQLPLR